MKNKKSYFFNFIIFLIYSSFIFWIFWGLGVLKKKIKENGRNCAYLRGTYIRNSDYKKILKENWGSFDLTSDDIFKFKELRMTVVRVPFVWIYMKKYSIYLETYS